MSTIGLSLAMAILIRFPHGPAHHCLVERQQEIATIIDNSIAAFPQINPAVLVSVGFLETHLGCDRGEGGGWGAPVNRHHRHTAGTPQQAALILWRSFEACGSWDGAARRFRTGSCGRTRIGSAYSQQAIRISHQLEQIVVKHNL